MKGLTKKCLCLLAYKFLHGCKTFVSGLISVLEESFGLKNGDRKKKGKITFFHLSKSLNMIIAFSLGLDELLASVQRTLTKWPLIVSFTM